MRYKEFYCDTLLLTTKVKLLRTPWFANFAWYHSYCNVSKNLKIQYLPYIYENFSDLQTCTTKKQTYALPLANLRLGHRHVVLEKLPH